MTIHLGLAASVILMILTAGGYAVATLGMKLASDQLNAQALTLIVIGLASAALAEIVVLRHANLAVIYLGIIAFESLLVLSISAVVGDTLSAQQVLGASLLLLGVGLVLT